MIKRLCDNQTPGENRQSALSRTHRLWAAVIGGLIMAGILTVCSLLSRQERGEEKVFSAFMAVAGESIDKGNRIQNRIAEKTGARAEVEWLAWQTAEEKIDSMIKEQEYPDFLEGSEATGKLLEAGALIPLDLYLDDYPNLKSYLTREQWESLRQEDGHIYYIPQFGVYHVRDMAVYQSGEAFWIQKRVLEWAGYPQVATLDEYFDLIESYAKEHPQTEGKDTIGFEILCDDWRYFCLENPPMFLAGYPNNGCAVVEEESRKAHVYDTIPQARQYFGKLSEAYHKGLVDPETFTLSYSQYVEKLQTGRVLGMVDQYWEIMSAISSLYAAGKDEYTYVPLPIVGDRSIKPMYSCVDHQLNTGSGLGISVSCEDVEGAMQFLNDLLDPEIMKLRFWGEEGVDYLTDEKGMFYQTDEMRKQRKDSKYQKENFCDYSYFPHYQGMLQDGINACVPSEQPREYFETLSAYDRKLLEAYGHQTWSQFLGEPIQGEVWYPLYTCISLWSPESEYGKARARMEQLRREWLPRLIMTEPGKFENEWERYMDTFQKEVNVAAYEEELNAEIARRVKAASDVDVSDANNRL